MRVLITTELEPRLTEGQGDDVILGGKLYDDEEIESFREEVYKLHVLPLLDTLDFLYQSGTFNFCNDFDTRSSWTDGTRPRVPGDGVSSNTSSMFVSNVHKLFDLGTFRSFNCPFASFLCFIRVAKSLMLAALSNGN